MLRASLFLSLALLFGCEKATTPSDNLTDTKYQTEFTNRIQLAIPNPWEVDANNHEDGVLIASISHSKDYLAVWLIKNNHEVKLLGKEETGFHPDDVIWVDWDADQKPLELLVTVEGISLIQLWQLQQDWLGSYKLVKLAETSVKQPPQNVDTADLDGDGINDLVVGHYSGDLVGVLWGKGEFQFETDYLQGEPIPAYPKIVDWDNDGRLDIVWGDWERGNVRFAKNLGEREFDTKILHQNTEEAPRQIKTADVNKDGFVDLLVPSERARVAKIIYNDGQGGIAKQEQIPSPTNGYSDMALSHDGEMNMLALSVVGGGIVLAKREQANEQWQLRRIEGKGLPMSMQFVDVNKDGVDDLLYTNAPKDIINIILGPVWEQAADLKL